MKIGMAVRLILYTGIALTSLIVAMPRSALAIECTVRVGLSVNNITATSITTSGATITWQTDTAATSQVFYDTESHDDIGAYTHQTIVDPSLVTSHSVLLTNLTARTTYYYRVKSNVDDLDGISEEYRFTTSSPAGGGGYGSRDTSPPRISEISVSYVYKTTAEIYWKTHEKSTSQVRYRASPEMLSELDEEMVIEHHVTLTGLTPATTYYYVTMSQDKSGNLAESDELTFTTQGVPASFDIRSLSISPQEAEIGEEVTISVDIFNTGDAPGTYEVALNIGDAAVDSEEVTLDGGTSQMVTFIVSRDIAATYSVGISSLSGSFVVSPAPPSPPTTPDKEEQEIPVEEPEIPVGEPEILVEEEAPVPFSWFIIGGTIAAAEAVTMVLWITISSRRNLTKRRVRRFYYHS
jgi:hypothetical protein